MSRGFFLGTIVSRFEFTDLKNLMTEKITQKKPSSDRKYFKKSSLNFLTEENDHLLKSLKRPGGSYRVA